MKYITFILFFIFCTKTNNSDVSFIDGDYWFPFPTVSMNYSNNCTIDMSYINWKIEEKIKIKNGHFYYKDKEVKFFGTNVAYSSAFPEKENAPKIAKRMAQLGINVVRFHHMDNRDIWGDSWNNYKNNENSKISQTKLDKLHYFLYCLKENGIYANINLHVSRVYPEMLYDDIIKNTFSYGKSLDRYYPVFINDQLKYANDLLRSYNNYTKYMLGDDPMILNIELNNENTMFNLEDESKVSVLTEKLKNELINQWRDFIKNKYKSYEEADKFYNNETIDLNNDLVENNKISAQKTTNSKFELDGKLVKFDITDIPVNNWDNQIHYGTIEISNYTVYTVEFEGKVNTNTEEISFTFQENRNPYRTYLRINKIKLTTEFQKYTLSAKTEYDCQFTSDSASLVKIILPPSINHYEIKNLKLFKGRKSFDFTENGEKSLEKILYPNSTLIQNLPNMAYDLRLFFMFTETNTQNNITNYIKNDLNFSNLLVLDSQISYGSFFTYQREYDNSDITDMHAYWEHPQFETGHSWDRNYYSIKNTPMIESTTFGTFNSISKGKCYNKPFTVSEYNHPFPNEHLHEKFAMFGSWAAFHDYDAIYQFSYDQTNEEYINGYFSMSTNPIDFAMSPYIALAFRNNYVKKSENYVRVKLTKGYIAEKMKDKNYNMNQFLEKYFYAGWNATYEVQIIDNSKIEEPIIETNINIEDKGYFINDQIQWNNTNIGNKAYYYVKTEKYITLTGFLGNSKMDKVNNLGDLVDIKMKLADKFNETCTIGLISLDDQKLERAKKLLLTIVGKVRNTDQIWNDDRTSTYDLWGRSPTLVQFIEFEAILKFNDKEKPKVFSINKFGELNKEFILGGNKNNWVLKSDENNPTLNYYIIREPEEEEKEEEEEEKVEEEKVEEEEKTEEEKKIEEEEDNSNISNAIIITCVILGIIFIGISIFYLIRRKNRIKNSESLEEGFFKNKL